MDINKLDRSKLANKLTAAFINHFWALQHRNKICTGSSTEFKDKELQYLTDPLFNADVIQTTAGVLDIVYAWLKTETTNQQTYDWKLKISLSNGGFISWHYRELSSDDAYMNASKDVKSLYPGEDKWELIRYECTKY